MGRREVEYEEMSKVVMAVLPVVLAAHGGEVLWMP
jgi:hypothetical protein